MPKVSQEHMDARKEQILEGARQAFGKHGYDGATVKRLEEEVGLSRGAIFHYFGGKQDLFVECASDMNRRFGDLLLAEGLDAAVRALAAESPEWLGVLIEAEGKLRHDPEFVQKMEARATDGSGRVLEWYTARQAEGTLRDDVPPVELARFSASLINGLALRVAGHEPIDVDTTLRLLNDALAPR
jgi:TetR/AcrR family transcriptional regulator, transcriptional repressor of aconitase